jgi:hypothetical protein
MSLTGDGSKLRAQGSGLSLDPRAQYQQHAGFHYFATRGVGSLSQQNTVYTTSISYAIPHPHKSHPTDNVPGADALSDRSRHSTSM